MINTNRVQYKECFGIELFEGSLVDHEFPWHFHPQYTIVLVEEGIMSYYFSDGKVDVAQNQLFIVNPFEVHYNKPRTASCTYKAIFVPQFFLSKLGEGGLPFFRRNAVWNADLFNELQLCAGNLKNSTKLTEGAQLGRKISTILLHNLEVDIRQTTTDYRILPALQHIEENTDKRLVIKDLASICCLSPFHFQRIFKQNVGLPVNTYIHQLKIEKSKQMLYKGSKISTAAFDTGYFDQSHFHRVFKKMYILPPAKFSK
jgi:AraC-like DNA-binding protein